jgi:hypothetical protein
MILTTFCFVCFIFPLGWIYGYNAYGFGLPNKGSFADGIDVRVTKGFGTRPYNQIRISVVSTFPSPPIGDFFDFSSRFMYKWRDLFLHSAVKETTPGKSQTFDIGQDFKVRLPEVGSGVAGVLLADPCVNSPVRKKLVGLRIWRPISDNYKFSSLDQCVCGPRRHGLLGDLGR